MHPIYEEDSRTETYLPPLRPCSHVTNQSFKDTRFSNRRVSFVGGHSKPKRGSYLESSEDKDDSSVETMTSASLYSLLNRKHKREPSFADYVFCETSFQSFVDEVKGTWEDAALALDQIVHAFTISDRDIDRMSEHIQLAEKSIDAYVVQAVREIGIPRC